MSSESFLQSNESHVTTNKQLDAETSIDLDFSLLFAYRSIPQDLWEGFYDTEQRIMQQSFDGRQPNQKSLYGLLYDDKQSSLDNTFSQLYPTQSTFCCASTQNSIQAPASSTSAKKTKNSLGQLKKEEVWRNRLRLLCAEIEHLKNNDNGGKKSNEILTTAVKFLGSILKSAVGHPNYLHNLLERYASNVISLGELLDASGSREFEILFTRTLRAILLHWTKRSNAFNQLSRAWHCTAEIISLMLRRITSVKILFAVESKISLILSQITAKAVEETDIKRIAFASEGLNIFLRIIDYQVGSILSYTY